MDDIIDNDNTEEVGDFVRPEDDFTGFMQMMKKVDANAVDSDNDEEESEEGIGIPDEQLPPSMRGQGTKKVADKENDEEDNDDDDEDTSKNKDDVETKNEDSDDDDEDNDYEDDELEVSLDTIITLPDGTSKSIAQLTQDYATSEEIKEKQSNLSSKEAELLERGANLDKDLALAKLEADDVVEKFDGFDWAALLAENPEEYGKAKMYVERHQKRSNEIRRLMDEREAIKADEEKKILTEKAQNCVTVLSKDIPGWSGDLYRDILSYAIDKGADPDYISKCTDPGVLKAFYDSMKLQKGENIVKAKVKRNSGSPKRTLNTSTKEKIVTKKNPVEGLQGREIDDYNRLQNILGNK